MVLALTACEKPVPPAAAPEVQEEKVKDRLELVLQPRRGWTPEKPGRRLALQLIGEKTTIRRGQRFGYRLELRNISSEALLFKEDPSFIKQGGLCEAAYIFRAVTPGGEARDLPCEGGVIAGEALELTLRSGEYLRTRPAGAFRSLRTAFKFEELGRYRLKVIYTDEDLRSESNTVDLVVVP